MRRTIEFDSIDDVLAEAERLQENGYDRDGNWSLGQLCNHLAEEVKMFNSKPVRRIPAPLQRLLQGAFLHTAVLGKFGTALGLRLPTIKPQNQPIDDAEGVRRLRDSFDQLQQAGAEHLVPFHLWHAGHHFSFLIPHAAAKAESSESVDQESSKSAAVS